jgi:hypothetical protein
VDKPETKHSVVAKLIAENMPKIEKSKRSVAQRGRYVHPTGKRVQDFALEYLEEQPNKIAKWAMLGKHIQSVGFSESSINNGISRLKENGAIKKIGPGMYKLVEKK